MSNVVVSVSSECHTVMLKRVKFIHSCLCARRALGISKLWPLLPRQISSLVLFFSRHSSLGNYTQELAPHLKQAYNQLTISDTSTSTPSSFMQSKQRVQFHDRATTLSTGLKDRSLHDLQVVTKGNESGDVDDVLGVVPQVR